MSGGFYIGLFAVLFLAIVIWSSMKRAGKKQHYDEMQLKIRADGYRLGYFVTIALLLVLLMVLDSNLITFVSPSFAIFVVMMIGIVTSVVYCIFKGAFFQIGQNGTYYIALCAFIGLLNTGMGILRILDGSLFENGVITFASGASFICGLSFVIILIALAIKKASMGSEVAE